MSEKEQKFIENCLKGLFGGLFLLLVSYGMHKDLRFDPTLLEIDALGIIIRCDIIPGLPGVVLTSVSASILFLLGIGKLISKK